VPYPVQIWPNPSRHCRATSLPSSHRTRDSRADSSLGGGSPAYTAAAGEAPRARVPPDAIPTTVEDRLSRLPVASFPWFISTAVSGQIGFLSSCRSRRKKHRCKWCIIAHVWVLSSRRPWPSRAEVEETSSQMVYRRKWCIVVLFGWTEPRLKESSQAIGSCMEDWD
jgi:hypothetical protein